MRHSSDESAVLNVELTTRGDFPGLGDYVQEKIGRLSRFAHRPVLHARVRLSEHADPAVAPRTVAQANLDVNGRLVRAQVEGATAEEAIDRLEARLRRRLEHVAGAWEAKQHAVSCDPHEWRHQSERAHRPSYFPRRPDQCQIIRRKSFTLGTRSVDEAAQEMALLAPFALSLTVSPQPAPVLTIDRAIERLSLLGLPFLFFIDPDQGRAAVLYHRYDGHYGLISPAG